MYKTILLCTDGSPAAEVAGDYAIWFARKLGASLRALYVTDVRLLEGPWLADLSGAVGAQPYAALLPQLQKIQEEKAVMVLAAAKERGDKSGVTCETTHETGTLVQAILDHERGADLVVLGQRGEHAQWSGGMLGSSVERVVRASVKPCLVTPGKFHEISHMLIAYDGSDESSKALRTGIALAETLGVEVTITMVATLGGEDAAAALLEKAKQRALGGNVKANVEVLHGDPEEGILQLRETVGADLIVMGAYGHSHLSEWIFGGVTRTVLREAELPVLMSR